MGVVVNRDFGGAGSWEEVDSVSLGLRHRSHCRLSSRGVT